MIFIEQLTEIGFLYWIEDTWPFYPWLWSPIFLFLHNMPYTTYYKIPTPYLSMITGYFNSLPLDSWSGFWDVMSYLAFLSIDYVKNKYNTRYYTSYDIILWKYIGPKGSRTYNLALFLFHYAHSGIIIFLFSWITGIVMPYMTFLCNLWTYSMPILTFSYFFYATCDTFNIYLCHFIIFIESIMPNLAL